MNQIRSHFKILSKVQVMQEVMASKQAMDGLHKSRKTKLFRLLERREAPSGLKAPNMERFKTSHGWEVLK